MTELYRVHFGYSKRSKYYSRAVELADLACEHERSGEGGDTWHTATLTEDQTDLMAVLYSLALKLPGPKVHGADVYAVLACCANRGEYKYVYASGAESRRVRLAVKLMREETGRSFDELADLLHERHLAPYRQDMNRVRDKLISEGLLDYIDPRTQERVRAKRKPKVSVPRYREIRSMISRGEYSKAVEAYYSLLESKYYGELTNELIYLKRLAGIPLLGRDLLYLRSPSSRDERIASNLSCYVACVDEALAHRRDENLPSPMDILTKYTPTMEQLIERRRHDWHDGVFLWDGEYKRDTTPVTLESFSSTADSCPEGRIFDRYPDPVQHCRVVVFHPNPSDEGLWTTCSPSYYQSEVLDKGLHLNGIDAYKHKAWLQRKRGEWVWTREPDFATLQTTDELKLGHYGTHNVRYTGRVHEIEGQSYYEINLERRMDGCFCHLKDSGETVGNPFLQAVEELLREAENLLREKLGLPRIGEGWVSETQLYRLVQGIFPDAQQHAAPPWLKPQHLDVYVPSIKVAFEYQGRQHFEPVEFFGGQESFEETVKRDRRKLRKCRANGVLLICWRYDESLNLPKLVSKLEKAGIVIESSERDKSGM